MHCRVHSEGVSPSLCDLWLRDLGGDWGSRRQYIQAPLVMEATSQVWPCATNANLDIKKIKWDYSDTEH